MVSAPVPKPDTAAAAAAATTGHPKGLYLLFTIEMWERFAFYGMRAILVLYMTKALLFDTQTAGTHYGWYTGLVYLSTIVGGYFADRWLGQRRCIVLGGVLMAAGQFSLAVPSLGTFYAGLALMIVGNGFFKPNISTLVGQLYSPDDARRDSAFTIFYMGINLGAFLSPLVCGTLGERVGWSWGFAAAGVGMLLSLVIYFWGRPMLGEIGKEAAGRVREGHVQEPLTKAEKQRIAVIFILSFFVIFFWASFEQAGSSLTLFAERETNRIVPFLDWEFPASWFQSVNPLLIFVLAPLFSTLWIKLAAKGRNPSTPVKMATGLALLAVGFVVMMAAAALYRQAGPVSFLWLFFAYFLHTVGELCLSPVGLSMVTKLAPARFLSMLMGIWFGANFVANLVGGLFAGNYDAMNHVWFFTLPVVTAGVASIVLFALAKPLERWMHGAD